MSTAPLPSSVAVWTFLTVLMLPVVVKILVAGSYNSGAGQDSGGGMLVKIRRIVDLGTVCRDWSHPPIPTPSRPVGRRSGAVHRDEPNGSFWSSPTDQSPALAMPYDWCGICHSPVRGDQE